MTDALVSVGRSVWVEMAAEPRSCRATAAQLSGLAEACTRAGDLLARHAQVGEESFGGLSGIVYRHSSGLLAQAFERTGRRSRRLADGLMAYADGLTEVRRQLDEAVAVAAPRLVVTGARIFSPLRPTGPGDTLLAQAWAAWHDAVARWRAARELEYQVSQAWVRAIDRPVLIDPVTIDPVPIDPVLIDPLPIDGGVR